MSFTLSIILFYFCISIDHHFHFSIHISFCDFPISFSCSFSFSFSCWFPILILIFIFHFHLHFHRSGGVGYIFVSTRPLKIIFVPSLLAISGRCTERIPEMVPKTSQARSENVPIKMSGKYTFPMTSGPIPKPISSPCMTFLEAPSWSN